MSMLALLALQAAAQPTELRIFRDWIVGCDNGRNCQAIALTPSEGPAEGWRTINVYRDAGPDQLPRIAFDVEEDEEAPAGLSVDGRRLAAEIVRGELGAEVETERSGEFLAALRSGHRLELLDELGQSSGFVSLAGASAAFLHIDEVQRRVGTVTAMVRPGRRPASAVPPAPGLPRIEAAAATDVPPRPISATEAARLRAEACPGMEAAEEEPPEVYRLDRTRSLAYVPASCQSGAYNHATMLRVAADDGPWTVPDFDSPPSDGDDGAPAGVFFNLSWDSGAGELQAMMKGRGVGDCGDRQIYVWDGVRFRLAQRWDMTECRGSRQWIVTWQAETVRP